MRLNVMSCCGAREITNLSISRSAPQAMQEFGQAIYTRSYADNFRYVIFTAADYGKPATYGTRFAKFIAKNNLGTVLETAKNRNPNTGNQVQMWVWTVNHDAVKAWLKKDKEIRGRKARGERPVIGRG